MDKIAEIGNGLKKMVQIIGAELIVVAVDIGVITDTDQARLALA